MKVSVGAPTGDDDLRALSEVLNRTYLRTPEEGEEWLKRVRTEDLRVVRSGGRVAGSLLLLPTGQWYGGRSVPMTGVAAVGVDPEVRAGGLASALMRRTLEELHERGSALSALYPATQPVYRRVGYELAGTFTHFELACSAIDVRDRELPIRRLEPGSAREVLQGIYEKRARRSAGHLDRADSRWTHLLSSRGDQVHVYAAGDEGYAVFGQKREDGWKYDLLCRDLVALSAAAARRLWTFFADHRSFATTVQWSGAAHDPMLFALREQEWKIRRAWTWMLRVVDVRGALGARGYPSGVEAEVHLDVTDDVLPWNHGRFVLEVSGGAGRVRKGGRGRIKVDVRGLAPLYTGFTGPAELRTSGYLDGTDKDLQPAGAVFGGPAPWLPDFF